MKRLQLRRLASCPLATAWQPYLWSLALVPGMALAIAPATLAQTSPAIVQEGYSYLQRGWVDDAIASFQQAVQRYPQSVEAQLGLATAYRRAGKDPQAWEAYQRVLQLDPEQTTALAAVGELGSYRPEWQPQGIAALTTLLELEPDNTQARSQRALLYGYQGQFTQSLADYDTLLADNPSRDTLLGAAQIYTFSGDYERGLALFRRYGVGSIPDNAASAYALALQETGDAEAAIAALAPRLGKDNQPPAVAQQIRASLAVAYGAAGQPQKALETLAPLRQQPEARLTLARALSALGRQQQDMALYGEAIAIYQDVLAATSNPGYGLRLEVADALSEAPSTQGAALDQYRRLSQDYPAVTSLSVKTVTLAYRLGEISAATAAQQLQQLVPPLPDSVVERRAIALALVRIETPDPALLPLYQAVVDAGLDAPLLLYRISQMQMQQGDLVAARDTLEAYRATPAGQDDLGVELLIADIEQRSGELDASGERYEALITKILDAGFPNDATLGTALRGLTFVREQQGQPTAVLPVYDQVMAAQPENLRWPLGWATVGYRTRQVSLTEAEQALNRWLMTYGNSLGSRPVPPEVFDLTAALPADAARAQLYQALLAINPNHLGVSWRAIQLVAQTDPVTAQNQLQALIAAHPDDPTVYFYQGELAQMQGDLPLAAQAYQAVLEQDPDNLGALNSLAGVRFQQGRRGEARSLYETVLSYEPDHWEARRAIAELNAAEDYRVLSRHQLEQLQSEAPTPADQAELEQRIDDIEFDLLRRRGFQPPWERY